MFKWFVEGILLHVHVCIYYSYSYNCIVTEGPHITSTTTLNNLFSCCYVPKVIIISAQLTVCHAAPVANTYIYS